MEEQAWRHKSKPGGRAGRRRRHAQRCATASCRCMMAAPAARPP